MSADDFKDVSYTAFSREGGQGMWDEVDTDEMNDRWPDGAEESPDMRLLVQNRPEKKYTVDGCKQFSQYLNKEASSRYQAIVLNVSVSTYGSLHFEVGLVHAMNSDHRNGVVHALRVSPFHVDFIQLDDAFFEYMHSHIYDAHTQTQVLEHTQKKQSQKTKNWGEGKKFFTPEEALAAQATAEADLQNATEEWIDLTNYAEYEQTIKRN